MALREPKRYAGLLRIRRLQEDLKAQVLGSARRDVHHALHEKASIETYQREILERNRHTTGQRVDAGRARDLLSFERHLSYLAVAKDADIIQLRNIEEEKHAELEGATIGRRIVERIIEHAKQGLHEHLRKNEQRMSDESSAVRYAHVRSVSQSQNR